MGRLRGANSPPPPSLEQGWYPDVTNRHRVRYWDGEAWTDRFRLYEWSESSTQPQALVSGSMVCTTPDLPGYRIVAVVGIVTELSANSGWTATSKGNIALFDALTRLRGVASSMGANAIVGLTGGPFGARGGVTSVAGGDAVGILLMGTAVRVEPVDEMQHE